MADLGEPPNNLESPHTNVFILLELQGWPQRLLQRRPAASTGHPLIVPVFLLQWKPLLLGLLHVNRLHALPKNTPLLDTLLKATGSCLESWEKRESGKISFPN